MLKVIVIGVPRSGTSLVASIVNELGFTIEHLPPTVSEPSGQWGGVDANKFVSDGNLTPNEVKKYLNRYPSMGVKIHGFDRMAIEDYVVKNYDFRVVLTDRKIENVVKSLIQKRLAENRSLTYAGIEQRCIRRARSRTGKVQRFIEKCKTSGKEVLTVNLNDLIEAPEMGVKRVAAFLGVDDRSKIESSVQLINPDYWHHK